MERQIGQTGMTVHAVGLGAMPLSLEGRPPEADAIPVLRAAFDAGINFIDTADAYCLDSSEVGHNERLVAKALGEYEERDRIIVATKGGCTRPEGRWETDGSPRHLREACEHSLRNLGVSAITLYQLHAVDAATPLEDSVGELARLQSEGKIRHIGLSNVKADQLRRAQSIVRIETVQNRFNPFEQRDSVSGMLELCREQSVTFISHSPVGGFFRHRESARHPVLLEIAEKYQASPYQVMVRWHLAKGPHVLPIPGASRVISAVSSAQAVELEIASADIKRIDALGR